MPSWSCNMLMVTGLRTAGTTSSIWMSRTSPTTPQGWGSSWTLLKSRRNNNSSTLTPMTSYQCAGRKTNRPSSRDRWEPDLPSTSGTSGPAWSRSTKELRKEFLPWELTASTWLRPEWMTTITFTCSRWTQANSLLRKKEEGSSSQPSSGWTMIILSPLASSISNYGRRQGRP